MRVVYVMFIALLVAFPTVIAAESPTTEPKQQPVTINFVGDILLDNEVDSYIRKNGVDYPFKGTSSVLQNADITFGNLETSVSTRGKPAVKQYTFRSRPETLQSLVNAGFDGVSLANNHTLDYGITALEDTMSHLRKYELGFTGAGSKQDEAFQPFVKEVRGNKVAILGISRVLPDANWYAGKNKPGIAQGYSMEPMMTYIKKAVKQSDYTIIYIHWSKERTDYPEAYARKYARAFIDAGVDAVIGAHSHSLHGIEWYKNKPIFYSLGNFVFTSKAEMSKSSMIVQLTLSGNTAAAKVVPARIVNTQPRLMDNNYNKQTYAKLNRISFNAAVEPDGTVIQKLR
ncbi:capsule biosynthesis protein [Cohnella kolymensis]|uniref:Capsule biosynthesis protein n=1 Tax=Cohnella kolymensis TaxID=1590652 RepID=A0ABR5A2Z7_9BACL|nr:CapA family protein [Cohnella kolymensis]KIL35063.1 capsule biosynthesis protein [Cohnella kolymensis]